jgi:hypothetical protein
METTSTKRMLSIYFKLVDDKIQLLKYGGAVGSQVDLLPTILERLNIPLPGGQICEGTSPDSPGPTPAGLFALIPLNNMRLFKIIN